MKKTLAIGLLLCALISLAATASGEVYTPGREQCGKENCLWETPMDVTNENALWAALIQPITVVNGDARLQEMIYASPDSASDIVGEVTCMTQGVHVIEITEDGWAKIECYSSSFHDSKVKQYNQLVTGYIRADLLIQREAEVEYALVVDKLTQRLYLFHEGKLLDTLLVSTGKGDEEHPWNETRSGEYVLNSLTGAFPSDELICDYGIRYNDGDLIHEVPHTINESGKKYYGRTEPRLGTRASHGCIRIQRKRTPNGINMRWLWNEFQDKMGTKLIIWEDWPGRQIAYPDGAMQLYYNPDNGKDYHTASACYGVLEKYQPLTAFTYDQLEDAPFAELTACPYCSPPLRKQEIDEVNAQYR